ncbi:MAG: hypothetical protein NTZ16_14240 [Verrucomicrobia bacterium]|nr:hypothetical protein [Verrucomicrobiota bacterium]
MPLRLNLLAEAQAEEELRRRDPVKRGIWAGGFLVALVLVWAGALFINIKRHESLLSALEVRLALQNKSYAKITQNERELADLTRKLNDLERLSTNRFLWGNLLNTLQKTTVPDVQMLALRCEQSHIVTEGTKAKTNEVGKITIGKPGSAVERIRLQFDAKDASATPGDQVGKFKVALSGSDYFRKLLGKTNEITLRNLSPPALDGAIGKTVVIFSLECRLPEKSPK